jgi:hypothetical protein
MLRVEIAVVSQGDPEAPQRSTPQPKKKFYTLEEMMVELHRKWEQPHRH